MPLLAFTLQEMYKRCRKQSRFTLEVYRDELGGMDGVVESVVKGIKDENKWSSEVDDALRRAFLKLVRMNEEGQFTRKPARWDDLPELAVPVLRAFEKSRLLASHKEVVEVTHESLFNVWPELNAWLEERREIFLWRRRVQGDLADWKADQAKLLPADRLPDALKWFKVRPDDLEMDEKRFIAASAAKLDREAEEERVRQERELETHASFERKRRHGPANKRKPPKACATDST